MMNIESQFENLFGPVDSDAELVLEVEGVSKDAIERAIASAQ